MKRRSFTLLELLIVVIIIGILATLGTASYTGIKEEALDREAKANLRLILAAERIYRLETGDYYASSSISDINNNLKLLLPTALNRNWNYISTANGAVACCAQAARTVGGARTWGMRDTDTEPVSGATCP